MLNELDLLHFRGDFLIVPSTMNSGLTAITVGSHRFKFGENYFQHIREKTEAYLYAYPHP